MEVDRLKGSLIRLVAVEPREIAEATASWNRDSEYQRLSMIAPANQLSVKRLAEWAEKDQEQDPPGFFYFGIRTLDDNRLIGGCGLSGDFFPHGEAFIGIGIGEREFWNKGYGTDAMGVILGYAFQELNLRRVALSVQDNNLRAIRSYEKAGFVVEGKQRGSVLREGQRVNDVFMGMLREEWLAKTDQAL